MKLSTPFFNFSSSKLRRELQLDQTLLSDKLTDSVSFIKKQIELDQPLIGIILGSGLGNFVDSISDSNFINTGEIPHYPVSTVKGHSGRLVHGQINGIEIIALQGRVHTYEGYEQWQVTYPSRLLYELGIRSIIITNASGCSNPEFNPGDFMIIKNHINFLFRDPLEVWERDSANGNSPYDKEYINLASQVSDSSGILLRQGILAVNLGPSYETPAEVKLQRDFGADAASMSTLPEVTVAHYLGMRVLGLSVLTNYAAGLSKTPLNHKEVTQMAEVVSEKFSTLLTEIIKEINSLKTKGS